MRNRHAPISSLVFLSLFALQAHAQLIPIPDTDLRSLYNSWVPGCVDANGDLDASLPAVQAYAGPAQIELDYPTITGLDAFLSLTHLEMIGINTVDAFPPNLEQLIIFGSMNATLPALPSTVVELRLTNLTVLTSLTVPPACEVLVLSDMGSLTSLGALPPSLRELHVNGTAITTLPSLPTGLEELFISYNTPGLSSSFTLPTSLRAFNVDGEAWTVLPALPDSLEYLFLNALPLTALDPFPPSLDSLVLYLPLVTELPEFPAGLSGLSAVFMPLQTIPQIPASVRHIDLQGSSVACLPFLPEELLTLDVRGTDLTCLPNIPIGCYIQMDGILPTCSVLSSVCPADGATIEGLVYHDVDLDGVHDVGEAASNFVHLNIAPLGMAGGVPQNGQFIVELPPGNYELSSVPSNALVQSITPALHTANLADASSQDTGNDFGLDITGAEEIEVRLVGTPARTGRTNYVWINVRNNGTAVVDAMVDFTFDGDQSWTTSTAPPQTFSGNNVTWSMPGLAMGEMRSIRVTLYTNTTVLPATPVQHAVALGAIPADIDQSNNADVYDTEVLSSYDPNDKQVHPATLTLGELESAELTYTIRFQNTGNAPAERVVITDTLSASLDPSSFRFGASSHPCNWTLFNGVLVFTFDPILLPDSTNDEPNSHGFVTFTMKASTTAGLGPIGNVANIYFDYNPPVITNEAVVDVSNAVAENAVPELRVFPVPADDVLWVQRLRNERAVIRVLDTQGRAVLEQAVNGTLVSLPVGTLPPGAYVLQDISGSSARATFLKR